ANIEVSNSISKVLWMATLSPTSLPNWNRMRISVNTITQNRAKSLRRLLASLRNTYYVDDEVVPISFNMDSRVDAATLNAVNSSDAEPVLM
ncbi:Os09g0434600, partial [Oryza sativa Japonica Group]